MHMHDEQLKAKGYFFEFHRIAKEGLLYVMSVRKLRFTICEISEEGLPYVRSVRKVYHL